MFSLNLFSYLTYQYKFNEYFSPNQQLLTFRSNPLCTTSVGCAYHPTDVVQSSRRQPINSTADLSHHRAYRSVHGGSLSSNFNNFVITTEIFVSLLFPVQVCQGFCQYPRACDSPIFLPGVRILPCFRIICAEPNQIIMLSLDFLPFLPSDGSQSSACPHV